MWMNLRTQFSVRGQSQEATHSTHAYDVSRQGILPRQCVDQPLLGWGGRMEVKASKGQGLLPRGRECCDMES